LSAEYHLPLLAKLTHLQRGLSVIAELLVCIENNRGPARAKCKPGKSI